MLQAIVVGTSVLSQQINVMQRQVQMMLNLIFNHQTVSCQRFQNK